METCNDEIIKILNNLRVNSLNLSEYHRRNYFSYLGAGRRQTGSHEIFFVQFGVITSHT